MTVAIKTIFWDIGGVLLTNGWDPVQRGRILTALGVNLSEYEARHDAANFYWERGLSTEIEFFDRTLFYEERPFTFEQLWQGVCSEQKVLHPGSFEILAGLRRGGRYKLATLNNESRELNAYRLEHFDLKPYFDFFICSGYVREMKPHLDIYRTALEIAGDAPHETLFIDDRSINCEAARVCGMNAIVFSTPEQLKLDLTDLGIVFQTETLENQ